MDTPVFGCHIHGYWLSFGSSVTFTIFVAGNEHPAMFCLAESIKDGSLLFCVQGSWRPNGVYRCLPMSSGSRGNSETNAFEPFGWRLIRKNPTRLTTVKSESNTPVQIRKSAKEALAIPVPLRQRKTTRCRPAALVRPYPTRTRPNDCVQLCAFASEQHQC